MLEHETSMNYVFATFLRNIDVGWAGMDLYRCVCVHIYIYIDILCIYVYSNVGFSCLAFTALLQDV